MSRASRRVRLGISEAARRARAFRKARMPADYREKEAARKELAKAEFRLAIGQAHGRRDLVTEATATIRACHEVLARKRVT